MSDPSSSRVACAGTGNPGTAASSAPSNGGRAVARSSPGAGGRAVPPSSPGAGGNPPQPEDSNYGSIVELIAKLKLTVDPSSILDMMEELPCWLRPAVENQFVQMDAVTAADSKFPVDGPSRTTFWMKVSSAAAFVDAVGESPAAFRDDSDQLLVLYLYVMPTIPLRDAHRIARMVQGAEKLPLEATLNIINPDDLSNKVAAFKAASNILADINSYRQAVQSQLVDLDAFAETHIQHANEMRGQFEDAKAELELVPEQHQFEDMVTKASVHLVARDFASVAQITRKHMADLHAFLISSVANLEAAMRNPTFKGCGPPTTPAAGGGAN